MSNDIEQLRQQVRRRVKECIRMSRIGMAHNTDHNIFSDGVYWSSSMDVIHRLNRSFDQHTDRWRTISGMSTNLVSCVLDCWMPVEPYSPLELLAKVVE